MTATVDAVLSTVQGDGTGDGKTITTPAGMTGKRVLAFVGSSSNADTIGVPASGTWAEVDPTGDKVITTSGGQLRTFEGRNLGSSAAFAFTLTGGRRTLGALVIGGEDDSGASMVDVAVSLESAAGSTHAPGSATPTASGELVVDCMMFRHFAPDTSTGSPPSTGLTWTEDLDLRGADSNNNVQMNIGHATAGSSGVAISTAAWNTDDPAEPTMVMRVVIKSAAGGGGSAAPNGVAVPVALGTPAVALNRSGAPSGIAVPVALGTPTAALNRSATPASIAVGATPGTPASAIPSASPAGVARTVALGTPAVALGLTAAPGGVAVPVTAGTPSVSSTPAPVGIALAVALGTPTVALNRTAAPAGIVLAAAPGQPRSAYTQTASPSGIAVPVAIGSPGGAIDPVPGVLVASGSSTTLAAAGTSTTLAAAGAATSTLTAGGTAATLTASGTP